MLKRRIQKLEKLEWLQRLTGIGAVSVEGCVCEEITKSFYDINPHDAVRHYLTILQGCPVHPHEPVPPCPGTGSISREDAERAYREMMMVGER